MRALTVGLHWLFVVGAVLVPSTIADGARPQPPCGDKTPTPVTDLGERYPYGQVFDPASVPTFSFEENALPGQDPVKHLRASITVRNPAPGAWFLSVRDFDHHLIDTLSAEDFRASRSRWTSRVPGSRIRLDVDTPNGASNMSFVIDEYIVMRNTTRSYYSLQEDGVPHFVPLYKNTHPDVTEDVKRWGDFSGFLMSSYGEESWACSGVAVASDLFLTNWHCGGPPTATLSETRYWIDTCGATLIDMSWDDDGVSREYRCIEPVVAHKDLDFALLKVAAVGRSTPLRPVPISLTLPTNKRVTLIHHPKADRKQVSPNCAVIAWEYPSWKNEVAGTDFTHKCDSEPGSSGAPVFDEKGRVIGLHHWGFKFDMASCTYTDKENKAVRIDRIVAFLRKTHSALAARLRSAAQ